MNSIKVLIIDDDADELNFYGDAFDSTGLPFVLVTEQDPLAALEYLQGLKDGELPDLIVCDLNMPKLNGFEVARHVKSIERFQKICFVICSNSSLPAHRQKGLEEGADAYFVKPLNLRQYSRLIEDIIEECLKEKIAALEKEELKKIRILLVEDNEDERYHMKDGFLQTGLYEVIAEAENGSEMLELLHQPSFSIPDLVVSDLNMPVRNGYEVIRDLKSSDLLAHIPVIILTVAPLVPFADTCKKMGACAYYTKPETFLEYDEFATRIYPDLLKRCLKKK